MRWGVTHSDGKLDAGLDLVYQGAVPARMGASVCVCVWAGRARCGGRVCARQLTLMSYLKVVSVRALWLCSAPTRSAA